ncbi:MAG: hypothetical protein ACRBF0_16325 [Calditrichia bacterium]
MLNTYLKRWQQGDGHIAELQEKALQNPTFMHYIKWLAERAYKRNALTVGKTSYPVAIFPARFNQENNFSQLLGSLSPDDEDKAFPEVFNTPGEMYLDILQSQSPALWNGPTYCMQSLDLQNDLRIDCTTGNYFDALISCDLLEFELLTAFGDEEPAFQDYAEFTESLTLRSALHQRGNPLFTDCGRSAAIGISTSILHRSTDGWRLLLRTCAPKIAKAERMLHAIPSGMMQPFGNAQRDFSILPTIYSEYLEEVWLHEEHDKFEGAEHLEEAPRLKTLHKMLDSGTAILQFSGVATDLLKLRPEICMTLIINEASWFDEFRDEMQDRDDFKIAQSLDEVVEMGDDLNTIRTLSIPLRNGQEGFNLLENCSFAPPGAAATFMGWRNAQRLISLLSFKGARW